MILLSTLDLTAEKDQLEIAKPGSSMEVATRARTVHTITAKKREVKEREGKRVQAARIRPKAGNDLHPGTAADQDVQEADRVDNPQGVQKDHLHEVVPEVNPRVRVPGAQVDHHEGQEAIPRESVQQRLPIQMENQSYASFTRRGNALLGTIASTAMMTAGKGANRSSANPKISVSQNLGLVPEDLRVRKALATENQNGNQIPKVSQESHLRGTAKFP